MSEIEYCFKCEDLFLAQTLKLFEATTEGEYITKIGLINCAYYLSIIYYKKNNYSITNIHYDKGFIGLRKLIRWGRVNKFHN